MFTIDVKDGENGGKIVILQGRLAGYTAQQLWDALEPITKVATPNIVVEMSQVEFLSADAMRQLLRAKKAAGSRGGAFRLRNVQDAIMEPLRMVGLDQVFEFETVVFEPPSGRE